MLQRQFAPVVLICLLWAAMPARAGQSADEEPSQPLPADTAVFFDWPPAAAERILKHRAPEGRVFKNACVLNEGPEHEFGFAPDGDGRIVFSLGALKPMAEAAGSVEVSVVTDDGAVHHRETVSVSDSSWADVVAALTDVSGKRVSIRLRARGLSEDNRLIVSEPEWIAESGAPGRPSVILISLDTLRADRLSLYGYQRPTSPHLDAFAREHAVTYERAIANSPWTVPSHMTMFTSRLPSFHGVNQSLKTFIAWTKEQKADYRGLPRSIPVLAETLRAAGYTTGAFARLHPEVGFARGFQTYSRTQALTEHLSTVMRWIEQRRDAPFFLFLHTYEIHAPYRRTDFLCQYLDGLAVDEIGRFLLEQHENSRYREFLKERDLFHAEICSALYDGGIVYTDQCLARLFTFLERESLLHNTMVVITSDHGEEFAEHSPTRFYDHHGYTTYQELLHIPLVIHYPEDRRAGVRIPRPVSLLDIAPTILAEAGVSASEGAQGIALQNLNQASSSDSEPQDRTMISEASRFPAREWKAVIQGRYKYIVVLPKSDEARVTLLENPIREMLFDLQNDPGETVNLIKDLPEVAERLRTHLSRMLVEAAEATIENPTAHLSDETLRQLKALGYVE